MEPGQELERVDVKIGIIATKNTEITGGNIKEGDLVVVGENDLKASGYTDSMRPPRPGRRR